MEPTTTKSSLPEERLLIGELTHRINNEFASVVNMISFAAARTQSVEVQSTLTAVMGPPGRLHACASRSADA